MPRRAAPRQETTEQANRPLSEPTNLIQCRKISSRCAGLLSDDFLMLKSITECGGGGSGGGGGSSSGGDGSDDGDGGGRGNRVGDDDDDDDLDWRGRVWLHVGATA